MNVYENMILSLIIIIFPILCYLFYIVTDKCLNDNRRKLVLSFTLLSIYYLLFKYLMNTSYYFLLVSIPIYIAYIKKYNIVIIISIISSLLMLYYYNSIYLYFFVIEQVLLFIFNNKLSKSILSVISVNIVYFILFNNSQIAINILYLIFFIIVFLIANYTIVNGEEIINYHIEYKELKRENELRRSLFKITHEIKNPLAVCKAYVDIFNCNDIESSKRYIDIISGEINKMLLLLQDFLLVNKDNINFDIMDINMLLSDINKSMLEIHHLNVDLSNNEEDEILINGDYNRLSQVLTNLIKNSYEANSNNVYIKSYLMDGNIVIDIIDDGDGIKKEDKDKIYEPFYTTKKDGTGLGVPLCKEIIEAHNGSLIYFSNNDGTTARIILPLLLEV